PPPASRPSLVRPLPPSCSSFLFPSPAARRALHSFPTRRSSDLWGRRLQAADRGGARPAAARAPALGGGACGGARQPGRDRRDREDRKSTRLNSSHVKISYAVLCLKKKKRRAAVLSNSPDARLLA